MHKIAFYGLVFILLISCKQHKNETYEDTSAYTITTEKWPLRPKVNPKVNIILKSWPEYVDLDKTFDGLYTVENTEDLSLVVEDLIEKQKLLAESEYPQSFDKPQLKSRQKVFHTFVLKTKGDLAYRLDPKKSVIEMIHAYKAWHNQFEIISGNTLDIKKLLEE